MRRGCGLCAVTAALLTSALAVPAAAGELPAPLWDWTGFYAGAHLGGGSAPTDWLSARGNLATLTPFVAEGISDGVIGGAQVGFNVQTGALVWGLEAEASWADLHGQAKCARALYVCEAAIDALGTLTGRFGYAFDHVLLYLKAGGAAARETYDLQSYFFQNHFGDTETVWGWTLGAGVEYALGGPWSAKVEYNYIDLGNDSISLADQFGNASTLNVGQKLHIVKLGLNHRFGGKPQAAGPTSSVPALDWTGLYAGAHVGAGWGRSEWSDPAGSLNTSGFPFSFGNRDVDGSIIGGQAGVNVQSGSWVWGAEAAAGWLDIDGNAKCDNSAGQGLTCRSRVSSLGTVTGRIGRAAGNALFYAKAGGAWAHEQYDVKSLFISGVYAASGARSGKTAGAGVEYALSHGWSMKAEYNYLAFDDERISFTTPSGGAAPLTIGQHIHTVTTGLNYRFGGPASGAGYAGFGGASKIASGWNGEVGSRYWYSSGRIQKDLFDPTTPARLNSRLSHDDLMGHSAETFARFDHDSGLFVKGNFGAGKLASGALIDEDFPGDTFYSNTFSNIEDGRIRYASLDLGTNFLNSSQGKLGVFLGYRHLHLRSNGFGCRQNGSDAVCAPPISQELLALSETNTWRGAAVGLNARLPLSDRLNLDVDAAYLPYVSFAGTDNHWFRADINPLMEPGHGWGTQFEAALSYAVTGRWSIGAGGRYWFFATGEAHTQFPNLGALSPMKFYTERYGAFLQSTYKFDPDRSHAKPAKAAAPAPNWTGSYAGLHLGAGRGQTDWSNPFGPQIFGDDIQPGGAIGGGQIGFNYQNGALVVGFEVEGSWSNIEGSNTCFVGLTPIGGFNCRAELGGLATAAGRLGFAQDRNLFFVKGGGAWARSEYEINLAGTGLAGVAATSIDRTGWLAGAGIERAITPSWSLKLEYDYIGFGSETVAFNVDPPINRVPVEQQLHLIKLGANYKFN